MPKSVNDDKDQAVSAANTWMMVHMNPEPHCISCWLIAACRWQVPFIISAVLSPFLGGVVDRVGQRANLMLASAVVLVGVHLFFALGPNVPCPGVHNGYCYDHSSSGMAINIDWYGHPLIGLVFQVLSPP